MRVYIDSRKIKIMLYDKRITQTDLANRINKHPVVLNQVLNRGSCMLPTANSIAKGLGVDVREIIKMED